WQQVRFGWEARLKRIRERFSPEVAERLSRAVDEIHERIAKPLLLGKSASAAALDASKEGSALPMVVDAPARHGPSV
ncbi:MAG: hypothetical protein L3J97_05850, partial [Thermoplasmata archaeon]|nr:hypothetical protein [Thermoplasmata archaeon]